MSHNVEGSAYAITCFVTVAFGVGNYLTVYLLVLGTSPTIVEVLRTEEVVNIRLSVAKLQTFM